MAVAGDWLWVGMVSVCLPKLIDSALRMPSRSQPSVPDLRNRCGQGLEGELVEEGEKSQPANSVLGG